VKMRLTAKLVAGLTLPPGKRDHIVWDSELPGFGYRMRLGANDKVLRTYVVQHKRGGRTSRLQQSAAALSAEQARSWARRLVARIALGEDPAADRAERRGKDRVTLKSMIDEHLLQKRAHIKPSTLREDQRYLTGPYFKPLHNLPVDQITRKDVASRLVIIGREHSSTIVARRARSRLNTFYVWAMQSGLVTENPVVGTAKPQDSTPSERVLSDVELGVILRAAADGSEYGKIIQLLILLGSRRGEVGGMCWSELPDLDGPAPVWTLPAARSKNGHSHSLPLGPMAVSIIKSVPRMVSRDALFGGRADRFTNWGRNKIALDARAGVGNWTVHDLRRTAASRMADNGTPPHVIEEVLNHRSGHRGGIGAVYIRSNYRAEVRAALLSWEDRVRALVDGTERKIVPMTPTVAP
jgi:integrase